MATAVEQFRTFAAAAVKLLPRLQSSVPVLEFVAFTRKATPFAVENVSRALPTLAQRAALLSRWVTDHDLLDVAGLAYAENPYIELLAWALRQETDPPSAVARQHAWLTALGLDPLPTVAHAAVPVTQFVTCDGRPDLLFHYPDGVVVVEAKVHPAEA